MKKQNYAGVAASVYINFALVGMATIIISQYSSYFQKAWNTDVKGISTVLSVVGIGRILTILFAGVISAKIIAVNLAFETEATQNGNKNWHNDIAALTNEFIVADFSGKASVRAG